MEHAHRGDPDRSGPAGRQAASAASRHRQRLLVVLCLTAIYMLAEVAGGIWTNSLALLADAAHMLTDVLGLGMALLAIRFAQRAATPSKTYGFYRAEILAALINSVVLFAITAYILLEAWQRFQEPREVQGLPMLGIAAGGLLVNLVGMRLLQVGAAESLNIKGAFLEVVADFVGSLGVLAAAAAIALTGWWQADPLVSVVIGLFLVPRTWLLLTSALEVLLEGTPKHINVAQLEAELRAVPGVASVHDLHVWTITSGFVAMSGHVQAAGRHSSEVLHDLQALLRQRFGIEHATLQVEQPDHADDGACCTLDPRCLVVGQTSPVSAERALGS